VHVLVGDVTRALQEKNKLMLQERICPIFANFAQLCISRNANHLCIAVGERMNLEMQDFDFPKSNQIYLNLIT